MVALSDREIRICELVTEGYRNRQVAEMLGIVEGTVKNYLRVIYDKIGMDTRLELAMWWHAHGSKYGR